VKSATKLNFLITAGPIREYIDPVRFISNASTGKMGYALARAAIKAGHKVTLITAPLPLKPPPKAKTLTVETSKQMFQAVKDHFDKCDCLIMAAAVSDYTPTQPSKTKIKKENTDLTIKLKPTKDILKWAGKNKKTQLIAGFALEDRAIRKNAERKLIEKNMDMIIANTPAAIASDKIAVQVKIPTAAWTKLPQATKLSIAKRIVHLIEKLTA